MSSNHSNKRKLEGDRVSTYSKRHQPQEKETVPAIVNSSEVKMDSDDQVGGLWSTLNGDLKKHIFFFLPALDMLNVRLIDKQTLLLLEEESVRSLDGIRLSYLNRLHRATTKYHRNRSSLPPLIDCRRGLFGRLINLNDKHPAVCTRDNIMSFLNEKVNHAEYVALQCMFEHNRRHPEQPQFVVAGGSMLACFIKITGITPQNFPLFFGRALQSREPHFSDIDIFVMEHGNNTRHDSDRVLRSVFLEVSGKIQSSCLSKEASTLRGDEWSYGVVRGSGTLTMAVQGKPPLQVVLRRISCIEELLCFFDLDCCRFAFDGECMFTTTEGLRSTIWSQNVVAKEFIKNQMYCRRAIKYGYRGFKTGFAYIHPLAHMLEPRIPVCDMEDGMELSEASPPQEMAMSVDEGLYSTLDNSELDGLIRLAEWKSRDERRAEWRARRTEGDNLVDTEDEEEEESDDEDDEDPHNIYNGSLNPLYRGDRAELRRQLMEDHGFARTFREHFNLKRNALFEHPYFESHLMKKYGIARCYMTGKWFKIKPGFNKDFSPEGLEINTRNAQLKRDLTGMVSIVTGARIKIGYETALELLRQGATVVATTRFAADADRRFTREDDYWQFSDRLTIYPLNLQCIEDVSQFVQWVGMKFPRIHILVNNAAQTVRLPLRCYRNLIALEYDVLGEALGIESSLAFGAQASELTLSKRQPEASTIALLKSAVEIQLPPTNAHLFTPRREIIEKIQEVKPEALPGLERQRLASLKCLFSNLHPDDCQDFQYSSDSEDPVTSGMNRVNSWHLNPTQIHPVELFETQTINHLAPTILLNGLVPYLACSPFSASKEPSSEYTGASYVINVTSIEGSFSVDVKESKHIHTNMSKSSLNMLTRSGASFYASRGILLNSVDTGWISSSVETWKRPPLSTRDGAMRILHPVLTQTNDYGKLYKNYEEVPW